ncbi:MAG: hypothetical protein KGL39_09210 [Patescibacteria group bacterium]|nr:hypothetical protein [Patescibacteria group bacterium]
MTSFPQFSAPNLGALVTAMRPNPLVQFLQAASQIPQEMQQAQSYQLQQQLAHQLISQNTLSLQAQQQQSQQQQMSYAQQRATAIGQQIMANDGVATPQQEQMLRQLSGVTGAQYLNPDGSVNHRMWQTNFASLQPDQLQALLAMTPQNRAIALKNYYGVDPQFLNEPQQLDAKTQAQIDEYRALAGERGAQTTLTRARVPLVQAEVGNVRARTQAALAGIQQKWAQVNIAAQRVSLMAARALHTATRARTPQDQALALSAFRTGITALGRNRSDYIGALLSLQALEKSSGKTLQELASDSSNPIMQQHVGALLQKAATTREAMENAAQQLNDARTILSTNPGIAQSLKTLAGKPVTLTPGEQAVQNELP